MNNNKKIKLRKKDIKIFVYEDMVFFFLSSLLQIMDMYKNEEMEYELGPKTEFYA